MFEKFTNENSNDATALGAEQIEQIRASLASSGPVASAALYNNGKSLNRSLAYFNVATTTTTDFSMSLMLMGG